MAAAQRRRDGMGHALVGASYAGNFLEMCRLINQGADVDYELPSGWMRGKRRVLRH
jgi:hypothetical protein